MCEIEPQAQRVLRRHFPGVRIINDVKEIKKDTFGGTPIELITGGFPCQDLSVAGRRKGLDGERSGLWFEYLRIIDLFRPRWVEIENVPGLLSSNGGRDFAVILRGLVQLGYCVAWRVFDSQFDGVAQRRERVFIVASLGAASCAEVLFERESSAWDSPPSREAGTNVTALTANGVGTCGADDNQAQGGHQVPAYQCHGSNVGLMGTLRQGNGNETGGVPFIALSSKDYGHDSQENITPTLRSMNSDQSHINGGGQIAIAFTERARPEGRNLETQDELAYALTNPGSGGRTHSRQIAGSFGVRRLTPLECERLQGYPNGWTERGDDGSPISDSARYRMLGNAVCLPTVEWIARRLIATTT